MTLLTFIIPVRHPDNAQDWDALTNRLQETVCSIAAQTHPDWRGVIVANEGARLPPLPDKFSVTRVTFPPNDMYKLGKAGKEAFLDAVRFDKGRRVLAGLLDAKESRFTMVTDDDDLVSNRMVEFVSHQVPDANGWVVTKGWLWDDGGKYFFEHDDFDHKCGTCLIIRRDLYGLPETFEQADVEWIKNICGSHHRIRPKLASEGTPLATLPFRGAVYRIGNANSHSQTPGILQQALFNRGNIKRPHRFLRNMFKIRRIGERYGKEFFGR